MSRKQTAESFWARVKRGAPDECWPWLGGCNSTGYGNVGWGRKHYTAHRVAYALTHGTISFAAPTDKTCAGFLLHSCDNPPCCNPSHLRLGTFSENQLESYERKRRAQPKGALHANAKLTSQQATQIRTLYAANDGDTYTLAERFGVSQHAVWLLVNNRTYKNAA